MANPNPSTRSDYRDIVNPRVRTRDILIYIVEGKYEEITSGDVAGWFSMGVAEGAARLSTLKKWNCVRVKIRGKGSQPFIYEVTKWGFEMTDKWRSKEKEL